MFYIAINIKSVIIKYNKKQMEESVMTMKVRDDYDNLSRKIREAKHRQSIRSYEGRNHEIVFYLYAQLLEGVENRKVSTCTMNGKIVFLRLEFNNSKITCYTIHKHSEVIKFFKLENEKSEDILKTLKVAMNLIGLNLKPYENKVEIFFQLVERKP